MASTWATFRDFDAFLRQHANENGGVTLRYTSRHVINSGVNVTYILKCTGTRLLPPNIVDTSSPLLSSAPTSVSCCFHVRIIADVVDGEKGSERDNMINYRLNTPSDGTAPTGNKYHHDHDQTPQSKSSLIADAATAAGVDSASKITDDMVDEVTNETNCFEIY